MEVEVELRNDTRAHIGAAEGEDETAERELRLLLKWLQDARREHLSRIEPVRQRARSGEMGSGLELILAFVSTSVSLAQLLMTVDSFRQARRPRSQIVIQVYGATTEDLEAARQAAPELTVLAGETEGPESGT